MRGVYVNLYDSTVSKRLGFSEHVLSDYVTAVHLCINHIFEDCFSVEDYGKFTHFSFQPAVNENIS